MTVANITTGGASYQDIEWHSINWDKAHKLVRRLQVRIAKAVSEGRWNKVKALQRLLAHSFSGKAVAVKRVTENHGKKTPGVDGGNLEHTGTKSQSYRLTQPERVSAPTVETGQHSQGKRETAFFRDTDHEGQGYAGITPTGLTTHR